jgi:hypothetical protein
MRVTPTFRMSPQLSTAAELSNTNDERALRPAENNDDDTSTAFRHAPSNRTACGCATSGSICCEVVEDQRGLGPLRRGRHRHHSHEFQRVRVDSDTAVDRADRRLWRRDAGGCASVLPLGMADRGSWSGDFIISSPPGYAVRRMPVPTDAIDRTGHSLLHSFPSADLFIVRKGQGAWHAHASEGSSQGPRDARPNVSVDHFKPVGATPPAPPVLTPNDMVMVFNAPYMEFWATKLTPADLSGAK